MLGVGLDCQEFQDSLREFNVYSRPPVFSVAKSSEVLRWILKPSCNGVKIMRPFGRKKLFVSVKTSSRWQRRVWVALFFFFYVCVFVLKMMQHTHTHTTCQVICCSKKKYGYSNIIFMLKKEKHDVVWRLLSYVTKYFLHNHENLKSFLLKRPMKIHGSFGSGNLVPTWLSHIIATKSLTCKIKGHNELITGMFHHFPIIQIAGLNHFLATVFYLI